jgi:hypothetical protein
MKNMKQITEAWDNSDLPDSTISKYKQIDIIKSILIKYPQPQMLANALDKNALDEQSRQFIPILRQIKTRSDYIDFLKYTYIKYKSWFWYTVMNTLLGIKGYLNYKLYQHSNGEIGKSGMIGTGLQAVGINYLKHSIDNYYDKDLDKLKDI